LKRQVHLSDTEIDVDFEALLKAKSIDWKITIFFVIVLLPVISSLARLYH